MDKKMVLGVVALIVVVLLGWYALSRAPGGTQPAAVGEAEQQSGMGTLGDLAAMGSVECQVTVDENGSAGQGTVYVAGGKMSGDFSTTVNGQAMHAYMINDGSDIYTWSDQAAQGFKMPASAASATTSASVGAGVSNATPAQYSCSSWTPDENLFVPPATITFMTMGTMPAGQ